MVYKILPKGRGLISEGTPFVVTPEKPLILQMLNAPETADLYLSANNKTVKLILIDEGMCVVPKCEVDKILTDSPCRITLSLIKEKPNITAWTLDTLVAQRINGDYVLVYPDDNDLRDTVATVTGQCVELAAKVAHLEKKVNTMYAQFDDTFITE